MATSVLRSEMRRTLARRIFLSADSAVRPGVGKEWLGAHADRRSRGTRAHARRPAREVLAHVALDRLLGDVLRVELHLPARLVPATPHEPAHEARAAACRVDRCHLDHAIGAVALAVATADAGVVDKDFAVSRAVDRIRRAFLHAVRVLAVPA